MSLAKQASEYTQQDPEDRTRGLKNVALVGGGVLAGTKLTKLMLGRRGGQGAANLLLNARKGRSTKVTAERVWQNPFRGFTRATGKAKIS